MIVKFHSFRIRTSVYRKRNKQGPVKVHLDLTKTRIQTLDKCRSLLNEDSNVKFMFADINCNMVAKMKNEDRYVHFDTVDQFKDILQDINNE